MNASPADLKQTLERINARLDGIETARSIVGAGNESATSVVRLGGTSDEQRLLRTFHARSLPELLQTNVCSDRFRHVSDADKYAVIQLKETMDCARFVRQMFGHEARDPEVEDVSRLPAVRGILDSRFAKDHNLRSLVRSFSSTGTGDGDEWVPTVISSNYVEEYELERKLSAAVQEIPMPSSPWELPVQTDVTRARLIGEGAAITDVNFGTDKIQFSAKKLGEYYLIPEELNEDSAPAILMLGRRDVVQAQVRSVEDSMLNGDTTGTHMDSDVTASDDNRKAWKGFRKLALEAGSTEDFAGGAISKTGLINMRKKMGKYGVNPTQLAWIFGPSAYSQAQALEIVETMEKFGPMATVLKGTLATIYGIPVIVSGDVRENLSDAGVYDGVTTNRTTALLVNHTRFKIGRRRPIRVRVQQDARLEYDRYQLASYQRLDFKGHKQAGTAYASGSTSSERSVILGIDILT
jgi:HK97 family phage major capsid protein